MTLKEIYIETKRIQNDESFGDSSLKTMDKLVEELDKMEKQNSLFLATRQYVKKVQEIILNLQINHNEVYVSRQIDTLNSMEQLLDKQFRRNTYEEN